MNDLFANPEIVQWAATIAATALLAGLGFAGMSLGIKLSVGQISQARAVWGMIRAEVLPGIIERVDEPGDAWLVALDKFIPGHAAPVMAATLPAFLRILADKAEERLNAPQAQ